MNLFNQLLEPVHTFGAEISKQKCEIATKLKTESRFNILVGLSILNIAIGLTVRGVKSRPLQTGLVSFAGFGFVLYPEMYFGLLRKKRVQQEIKHYFIVRD